MNYINEICPGCGKAFAEGDDVVVCPECATPQHRECWNKTNSCVNGYLHASGYEWQPSGENAQSGGTTVCPMCGGENAEGAFHCSFCGAPLSETNEEDEKTRPIFTDMPFPPFGSMPGAQQFKIYDPPLVGAGIDPNERIGEETASDISAYLKRSQNRFIPKFRKFEQGAKVSWNWCAFLLTPYYFFYRRLHKVGLVFAAVAIAVSLIITPVAEKGLEQTMGIIASSSESVQAPGQLTEEQMQIIEKEYTALMKNPAVIACIAAMVLSRVAAGLFADRLYYERMKKDLNQVREITEDENMYYAMYSRVGGTNVFSLITSYFGMEVVVSLLMGLVERMVY